jgi:hypothetical protein
MNDKVPKYSVGTLTYTKAGIAASFFGIITANGLTKQFSQMTLTVLGAMVLDWVTQRTFLTDNYRYGSLWTGVGFVVQAVIFVLIYREWQRLGGDRGYKAPGTSGDGKS